MNLHKLSYIVLEREINNKVNAILNIIVHVNKKYINSEYGDSYLKFIATNYSSGNANFTERSTSHTHFNIFDEHNQSVYNDNIVLTCKHYSNASLNLLKQCARSFHRDKSQYNTKNLKNVKNKTNIITRGNYLNDIKNGKELNNRIISELNYSHIVTNLDDIKHLWLKHIMIIFKIIIESNLMIDIKRKLELTTFIVNLLKNKNINISIINTDLFLSYAYLLSTINRVDREFAILLCERVLNNYKSLNILNKFYLFSSIYNFNFLSKKFQQMTNYMHKYFYSLIKEEYLANRKGNNIPSYFEDGDKGHSSNSITFPYRTQNHDEIVESKKKYVLLQDRSQNKEYLVVVNNYLFNIYDILFKNKKHISHEDRSLFKHVINEELLKYNKINYNFFRMIIKMCDHNLVHFMFTLIVNNLEAYNHIEINNILIYCSKNNNNYFCLFWGILKENGFENINIRHVIYLYIYINRMLKRKMKKKELHNDEYESNGCNIGGKIPLHHGTFSNKYVKELLSNPLQYKSEKKGSNTVSRSLELNSIKNIEEEKNSTKKDRIIQFNKLMNEWECYYDNLLEIKKREKANKNDINIIEKNMHILKNINDLLVQVLKKKIYYLNVNNVITLLYNTCPIYDENQAKLVHSFFSQLFEDNQLVVNFTHIYNELYKNFIFYNDKDKLSNIDGGDSTMEFPLYNSDNIKIYEKRLSNIFSYIKKRYYINNRIIYNTSKYTIMLNVYNKFVVDILMFYLYKNNIYDDYMLRERKIIKDFLIHIYTHILFIFFNKKEKDVQIKELELIFNYSRSITKKLYLYAYSIKYGSTILDQLQNKLACMDLCENPFCDFFDQKIIVPLEVNTNDEENCHVKINEDHISPFLNEKEILEIVEYVNYACTYIYYKFINCVTSHISENIIYIYLCSLKYSNKNSTFVNNNIFTFLKNIQSHKLSSNIIFAIALDYIRNSFNVKPIVLKLFRVLKKRSNIKATDFTFSSIDNRFRITNRYYYYADQKSHNRK
ncbi:conserved Plasmodium protein, unknown function [Plasmodium berghei]|uniref:Uncharacterized protein n=2 Tax=Plasmodium berghei TaxID=5821 RepID=A0A509AN05_PLABA|nr:conserved Plasmodium protein, unknown function [Plasmodium berghei ANKA]CXI50136.1 conserved Plasmodium protein, unknown function [Plasmodium berghei]SCL94185.1 conserved Plasmodium protein, unknown function [Plasmodium berghei]SCM15959.1 conserved Plasmodium protein, unknown function [Plasmodium berghei]SCM17755.1 conserved Plasmodium protein, unknown function [Plasmodium berghei]SCN25963.1 conserved Plasmodium protein, unknown function [Plasmodium berghei]|eukprot:XP_034421884.1 conserved Plasmodium protein, unknown function [Plasmodium berghei ANKA]